MRALALALLVLPTVVFAFDGLGRMREKKEKFFAQKRFDETGHVRMGEPQPGEWLHSFEESGQDDQEYKKECKNKRREGRAKIYLQELGTISSRCAAVQPAVRDFLKAFFQLEVVSRDAAPLPKKTFVASRKQYDGDQLLNVLEKRLPGDALVSVGLLDEDLFSPGLNFIFGEGSLERRVGVYSFVRFGAKDESLYRMRCFRLVAHEIGHIVGMEHCIYYECVMNGANSLDEDDGKPLHLCPVCLAKLQWNVGFDELAREKELLAVLEREKLKTEAAWSKERIERLEKK